MELTMPIVKNDVRDPVRQKRGITSEKQKLHEKLFSLKNLSYNWDEDGAVEPSAEAFDRAYRQFDNHTPSDVDADANGGIVLWYNIDSGYKTVLFSNTGSVFVSYLDENLKLMYLMQVSNPNDAISSD